MLLNSLYKWYDANDECSHIPSSNRTFIEKTSKEFVKGIFGKISNDVERLQLKHML